MQLYRDWAPTSFDTRGLAAYSEQDWLVAPCGTNRDAGVTDESNWHVQAERLAAVDPDGADHKVLHFGHWACGWFEIVVVRTGTECERVAQGIESALADYPLLDDNDHSEREYAAACEIWKFMRVSERIAYIRDHRSQFEFHGWTDLMACVRGNYFAGYASELVER